MYLLLISTFLFCGAALSAEIVDLNQKNIKDFMNNQYAVAFFCDFDHHRKNCNSSTTEFLKAADILTNNKFTIAFGKMDHIKNKWINMQINNIDESSFIFFHYGRYEKFWGRDAKTIVNIVKEFKNYTDGYPNYFHWEYKDWKEEALIIDLNKNNMEEFAKNDYAFAFFCDFDNNTNYETRKDQFLTAADELTEEKTPINFGLMDYSKNKWIIEKMELDINSCDFVFFCGGKYAIEYASTVKYVKKFKEDCDSKNPKKIFSTYNK